MKIEIITASEIDGDLRDRWRELQTMRPAFASPYFCSEFIDAVASVRSDVFIAVIEDGGEIRAVFPYQRGRFGTGRPVGGQLNDFHGVLGDLPTGMKPSDLLGSCRLNSWSFHYLPASQLESLEAGAEAEVNDAHFIDLTQGYEAYEATVRASGSKLLKKMGRKLRNLERDIGEVRFEPHVSDSALLGELLEWKSRQYRQAGLVDVFSFKWARHLVERIHALKTPDLSGMLSALYAGDSLVAMHMGMRSRSVWNWWFPRHDPRFDNYSPGILLRLMTAKAAAEMGIKRMDLGQGGDDTYKPRLATGAIPVATGRLELPSLSATVRRATRRAESWIRSSPILPLARIPGRLIKRMERVARFR